MNEQKTETQSYEARQFLREVRSITPESAPDDVRRVIGLLRNDQKAQMGRLYLARQAKLHGVHMFDWCMPRYLSDSWQPAAYLGAAFYGIPEVPHSELVKQRLFGNQDVLQGRIATSIEHQPGARATVGDVWPEALAPESHAVTVVTPELIPMTEESSRALAAGRRQYDSIRDEVLRSIAALSDAVRTFDRNYVIMQIFRGKHRSLLGTTLDRAQILIRSLDALWCRVQREIYAPALGLPNERPGITMTAEGAQTTFVELASLISQLRTNLQYLKLTP